MDSTIYEILNGKRITNVCNGIADGSILIRLDDKTEILIKDGNVIADNGQLIYI